ncbi:CoA-dependent acyltransferase [Mycena vulgaris]|nr:CoA-dependent acyltransferase [Mycena vulgaris]
MFLRPLRPSRAPCQIARFYPYLPRYFHASLRRLASSLHTFKLADIGEGITECEVIRWAVTPATPVRAFDTLCEVQSDKASVELTSPVDGVVRALLVQEGAIARVGEGLCTIEVEGGEAEAKEAEKPVAEEVKTEEVEVEAPAPKAEVTESPARRPHPLDPTFTPAASAASALSLATPSVRHYARTQGVDLALLAPGRGRGGRVEKADVDAFLASPSSSSPSSQFQPPSSGEDIVVELGRTRAAMWRAMVKSLEIPTFGYTASLDITDLHALLPLLTAHIPARYRPSASSSDGAQNKWDPAHALGAGLVAAEPVPETARYARLTYLPFLIKALARAMMEWPLFRAAITSSPPSQNAVAAPAKPTLTIRPHADVALALATPTGLYTPLLRAANTRSVYALASEVARLAELGRRVPCGLGAADLGGARGPTITVSNVGAAGRGTGAAPVLIPGGGVAIVAIGRAEWVWDVSAEYWGDDASGVQMRGARRLKVPVSWTADHRVVEGAEMAAFVECWRGWVEYPGRMVGEGV